MSACKTLSQNVSRTASRCTYEERKDDVAQIALRAGHCIIATRLLRNPLALFAFLGFALHFGCARMLGVKC